jgi:hypothetical protein
LFVGDSNEEICSVHEASLNRAPVTDYDNIKEIESISDSVKLENIYHAPVDWRERISIWIVDHYMIHKNIYPDFGLSGNDLSFHFIPAKEIWLDVQVPYEVSE